MARSFVTPQPGMIRCIQLPGRNVLLTGAVLALLTALMTTSSSYLAQLDRQRTQFGRQEIRGTISLHGNALAEGRIQFICQLTEAEIQGFDVEAPIVDGRFHFPKSEGPPPGWYIIRILAADKPVPDASDERPIEVLRDYEHRIARFPVGTDLFVRLHRRKLHRFTIDLKDPVGDIAPMRRGDETGLVASLTISPYAAVTISALAIGHW